MPVFFHSEKTNFSLSKPVVVEEWLYDRISKEKKKQGDINIIFTCNEYLLEINNKYLNHNYFTDVITFDYSKSDVISGDVFISIEQVALNAEEYGETFNRELLRVIIHGVLHLLGYDDKTVTQKNRMREKEDEALKSSVICEDGEII